MTGKGMWLASMAAAVVAGSATGCSESTRGPGAAERPTPLALALECSLSVPPHVRAGEPVMLRFGLRNPTAQPLAVLTWNTPLEGFFGNYLQVTRDGAEVLYTGPMVKRGDPDASSYVTVAPGGSAERQVELSLAYDMKVPGKYRVEMRGEALDVATPPSSVPRPREQHRAVPLQCPPVETVVAAP